MNKENLLIEIGTEELPATVLVQTATNLKQHLQEELNKSNLSFKEIKWFASPRRLAAMVYDLDTIKLAKEIIKKGPAIEVAFDASGKPTPAGLGWAKSCGIEITEAQILKTDKGSWLTFTEKQEDEKVFDLLPEIIKRAIGKLNFNKSMRWGVSKEQFIRPVKTLNVLFGNELIDLNLFDIKSDRKILGHRFLSKGNLIIENANQYLELLENQGFVIADFNKRQNLIVEQASYLADTLKAKLNFDQELLDEVTSLVEFPKAYLGKFDTHFLNIPKEVLVETMTSDQRYFPLYDQNGNLIEHFIFIANINPVDPSAMIKGNEKVIRARFADAQFFFKSDLENPLINNLEKLQNIVFHEKLGTLLDKTERLKLLTHKIAQKLNLSQEIIKEAEKVALLAKCDLLTNMVFEFPSTQGVMGQYYAKAFGEKAEIATALFEQYLPRFAGDELPNTQLGAILALADKLDTLVGLFAVKQPPKASSDPFALRRSAIGIIRILIETDFCADLDLKDLIKFALEGLQSRILDSETLPKVLQFLLDRLCVMQEDEFGIDVVKAVLATGITHPLEIYQRIKAVKTFKGNDNLQNLIASNKRINNILKTAEIAQNAEFNLEICNTKEEKILAENVFSTKQKIEKFYQTENINYALLVEELSQLREPIDQFFDNVLVNDHDPKIKQNRLLLLKMIHQMFLQIADITLLQTDVI